MTGSKCLDVRIQKWSLYINYSTKYVFMDAAIYLCIGYVENIVKYWAGLQ